MNYTTETLTTSSAYRAPSIQETTGMFGELEMSYEDMYDSLYIAETPKLLSEVVKNIADSEYDLLPKDQRHGEYQFLYYDALESVCEELGLPYSEVSVNIAQYDVEIVYLVNYKGEGEGYFIYNEDTKKMIAGTYNSKYDYS